MKTYSDMKLVKVNLHCFECKTAMYYTDEVLLSESSKFPHRCPSCGKVENHSKMYPHLDVQDVPESELVGMDRLLERVLKLEKEVLQLNIDIALQESRNGV